MSAHAQIIIALSAGSTPSVLIAPNARLSVPIVVDMSQASGVDLASLASGVTWGTSRLTLDSVRAGAFGTLSTSTAAGTATLTLSSATGTTNTTTIATMYFTASAGFGGTQILLSPSAAASGAGTSLAGVLQPRALDVCIAATGKWGDASGDGAVNIIDAQQVARFSVGLSVANLWAVQGRGDVTGEGAVNIIDAQQIARFSVQLPITTRVAGALLLAPAVASVAINSAPASLAVGQGAQLSGAAFDANGAALGGCGPIAWASSDTAIASVSASARATGRATGSVAVSASAGGKTASATVPVTAIFQDRFIAPGNQLDLAAWTTEFGPPSYLGRTQLADWVHPGAQGTFVVGSNGAELALNTYNPTGVSLFGTHGKTLQSFQPLANTAVYVTTRLQLTSVQPGIVYGLYLFGCTSACATNHDELDIEIVTNELQPGAPPRVQVNRYANEPLGAGHGGLVALPAGFDPLAAHDWTVRWSLSQVDYYVDGLLLASSTTFVPQGAMTMNVNAWGPDTQWTQAYSASLQPVVTAQQNSRYVAYVKYIVVSAF